MENPEIVPNPENSVRVLPSIPAPQVPNSLLPSSRKDFVLRLPEHEIKRVLDPINTGTLGKDTVFCLKDPVTDLSLAITGEEIIEILEENHNSEISKQSGSRRKKYIFGIAILFILFFIICGSIVIANWGNWFGKQKRCKEPKLPGAGSFLIFGGINSQHSTLDSVELYSPDSTENKILSIRLLKARFGHVAALLGDTVVIAGGSSLDSLENVSSDFLNPSADGIKHVELFNRCTQTFSIGPELHTGRVYATGAVVEQWFYICGGITADGKISKTCEKIDSSLQTWQPGPTMARARRMFGLVYIGAPQYSLLAVGGATPRRKYDDEEVSVEILKVVQRPQWKQVLPWPAIMIPMNYGLAAANWRIDGKDNFMICGGGLRFGEQVNATMIQNQCVIFDTYAYSQPNMVSGRALHSLVAAKSGANNQTLCAFGGFVRNGPSATASVQCTNGTAWSFADDMKSARTAAAVVTL